MLKNSLFSTLFLLFLLLGKNAMSEDVKPLESGYLRVSNLHEIYYETFGNPQGLPVVVVHGGPGAGCKPSLTQFFDLEKWYIVMFDQRGAMRSRPSPCLKENTTQNHIADIETLREHLSIDKWVVFGGSWGSLLGVLYGEAHPNSCLGFILRGVFLGSKNDITHAYYGMGEYYPEAHERLLNLFSEDERKDLKTACYNTLQSEDSEAIKDLVRAWVMYCGNVLIPFSSDKTPKDLLDEDSPLLMCAEMTFFHFAYHNFFIEENQVLRDLHKICHLPASIVHGRYDRICLPDRAYQLHKAWEGSKLQIVEKGTHIAEDPEVCPILIQATADLHKKLVKQLALSNEV